MDPMLFPASGKRRVRDGVTGDLFADDTKRRGRTFEMAVDKTRLLTKLERVIVLLSDHQWHALDEIRSVGGSSGDRRLRDLRTMGFVVDARRDPATPENSGAWEYCCRVVPGHQVAYVERLVKHSHATKKPND